MQVTVTVGSTQDGYVPGSSTITGASLLAAHTPEFEADSTTDGFKAKIRDYGTYQWGATINQGSPGSVDIVTEGLDHYVVVSGLATGGERSTATVTATVRNDSMPGSAQISGRSILGSLTPSFGDATSVCAELQVRDLELRRRLHVACIGDEGAPVISTETVNDVVHHVVTVTGLANGEESIVTVWAENLPDVSTSNTKTSSALNGPRVPDLGDPEPTDGGFKVDSKNYLDGFVWNYTAPPGSVERVEEGTASRCSSSPGWGSAWSPLTVTATQNGYLPGEATKLGKSLMAALTPGLDARCVAGNHPDSDQQLRRHLHLVGHPGQWGRGCSRLGEHGRNRGHRPDEWANGVGHGQGDQDWSLRW